MPESFNNPVYPAYFADPFCFLHDGTYYAIGTGKDEADACPRTGNVVPMIKSPDLHHWQKVGPPSHVLEQHPDEKGGYFWAPEIAHDGRGGALPYVLLPGWPPPGPAIPHPLRHQRNA